jgi:hypothetical protein
MTKISKTKCHSCFMMNTAGQKYDKFTLKDLFDAFHNLERARQLPRARPPCCHRVNGRFRGAVRQAVKGIVNQAQSFRIVHILWPSQRQRNDKITKTGQRQRNKKELEHTLISSLGSRRLSVFLLTSRRL